MCLLCVMNFRLNRMKHLIFIHNKMISKITLYIVSIAVSVIFFNFGVNNTYATATSGDQLLCHFMNPSYVEPGYCCPEQGENYIKEVVCNSPIPPGYWEWGDGGFHAYGNPSYYVYQGTGSSYCGEPASSPYYAWNTENEPHHTYVFWSFKGCIWLNEIYHNPYWESSVWTFMPSNTSQTSTGHASYFINYNQYWYSNIPWNQTLYNNQWKMLDYDTGWVHQLSLKDTTGETYMTRKVHYDDAFIMYHEL